MVVTAQQQAARAVLAVAEPPAPSAAAIRSAALETLHDAAADERLSARLAVVGAAVAIELRGRPSDTFVLRMLDGSIAIAEDAGTPADVRITMDAVDLHELFAGGLHLPMKIAQGDVAFTGQVRRFLRVAAILARLRDRYLEHLEAAGSTEGADR